MRVPLRRSHRCSAVTAGVVLTMGMERKPLPELALRLMLDWWTPGRATQLADALHDALTDNLTHALVEGRLYTIEAISSMAERAIEMVEHLEVRLKTESQH